MEYNKLIAEMHTGDDVEGFYVLKDAFLKTTAAGKPFLSGVLADRSGVIDLKVWDYSGPIGARPEDIGRVVKIRGQVSEFKGAPQLKAASAWRTGTTSMTFPLSCQPPRLTRMRVSRRLSA